MLSFAQPEWLAVAAPLVPYTWYCWLHTTRALEQRRARLLLAVRVSLLGALVLALAGPQLRLPSRELAVLFLVDRSASVAPAEREAALELVRRVAATMPRHARAGLAGFGGELAVEALPEASGEGRQLPSRLRGVLSTEETDVAGALRAGAALLPDTLQRRLVLLSDGRETRGDAREEAAHLAAQGVPVDVIPVGQALEGEVRVEGLAAPPRASPGEQVELRVTVRATAPTGATLRLLRDGNLLASRRVSLREGLSVLEVTAPVGAAGFHQWEAVLEPERDGLPENNRGLAFTRVAGRERVLVLEGTPGAGRHVAAVLRGGSARVEVRPAVLAPSTAAALTGYTSLVLVNVRADQLSPETHRALVAAVRDLGTGLVAVGGGQSLTAGGWRATPLAEAMPLLMEAPRRRDQPALAVVFVVDVSGSMDGTMDGVTKLTAAVRAAEQTLEGLRAEDEVGVLAFDDGLSWTVPLGRHPDIGAARSRLQALRAGGGTNMYPALAAARDALARSRAAVKHIVALTDGLSAPGDFHGLARRLAGERITLTTLGVGPDSDFRLLRELAERTGGRHYEVTQPAALPIYFSREVELARGLAVVEEPFRPQAAEGAAAAWPGLAAPPALLGYVATMERPDGPAQVLLRSHRGDPILATWRHGLGRVTVFTADAGPRWAAPWVAEPGGYFARFWRRIVGEAERSTEASGLRAEMELHGAAGRLAVEAAGRLPERPRVRLVTPGGARELRLDPAGAGRWEATFPAGATGQYLAAVTAAGRGIAIAGVARAYPAELGGEGPDLPLLLALAERTGGTAWPAPAAFHPEMGARLFRPAPPGRPAPVDLWGACVLAAVLLLPLDIALRRLAGGEAHLPALLAGLRARLMPRRAGNGPVEARTDRLLRARARAAHRSAPPPPVSPGHPPSSAGAARDGEKPPPSAPAAAGTAAEEEITSRLLAARRSRQAHGESAPGRRERGGD